MAILSSYVMMIIGIDEVGRGALIGNVVTAAVHFPKTMSQEIIQMCTDSKKLSQKKRKHIFDLLTTHAHFSIGEASHTEVDKYNILKATLLAMKRAFTSLHITGEDYTVMVDGNQCPQVPHCKCIVGGDALIAEIGAASIIAKVVRDKQMIALDAMYPQYGFSKHKGYPTKQHLENLYRYGALEEHRKSYAPVKNTL